MKSKARILYEKYPDLFSSIVHANPRILIDYKEV